MVVPKSIKRWLRRGDWLRWLAAWGISVPGGMGSAELIGLLRRSEQPGRHDLSRKALPPPHGPEQLAPADLTPVERELWHCFRGEHGPDCTGHT
jgi:hypothetical protein